MAALKPPFVVGDIVTAATNVGDEQRPKGQKVWVCTTAPARDIGMGGGFQYLGVSVLHFRKATVKEIDNYVTNMKRKIATLQTRILFMETALRTMTANADVRKKKSVKTRTRRK